MQQNTEDTTAPGDEVKSRLDDGAGFQNRQSATDGSNAARAATMATDETEKNATSTAIRVSGKVVKPNGERLQGAKLYWPRTKTPEPIKLDDMYLQQVASSGRDGSFTAELVFPSMPWLREVPLISVAEGFGMAWVDVSPKQTSHELTLRMAEEFPISGRILTTEGVPVPNATIGLTSVMADSSGRIDTLLTAWKSEWRSSSMKVDKVLHIGLHLVGEVLGNKPTDQQGRFAFRGLGREQAVWLKVSSPSIANSLAIVITREGFEPEAYNEAALAQAGNRELYRRQTPRLFANHFTLVAEPGKVITGKVTDIDSGEPLEGVVVDTSAGYGDSIMATTDANGKYRLAGVPVHDDDVLISFRKRHTRYLPRTLAVKLTAGLSAMEFDAGLAKGVLLKGRVTETETGKPVSGGIRFAPLEDNAWKEKPGFDNYKRSRVMESVDRDGTFEFVSIPGPGVLLMQAGASGIEIGGLFVKPYRKGRFSKEDREKVRIYVEGESFYTSSNGLEFFQNGMKVVDVPEDVEEYTVDLTVDRGVDADVAILDDQGQPLSGAMVCGVTETWPITYSAKEPSIRIYALDPDHPRRVIFYHQERQLACALVIRGDEDEPIVARLQPTKTLVGRAVTPAGDPLAGAEVNVGWNDDTSREFQRQLNMTRDRVMTDEEGRFRVEGALPGVFRLSFSVDDKRYSTETKWDDVRTIASTLIPVGGSDVTLGEITVKPR